MKPPWVEYRRPSFLDSGAEYFWRVVWKYYVVKSCVFFKVVGKAWLLAWFLAWFSASSRFFLAILGVLMLTDWDKEDSITELAFFAAVVPPIRILPFGGTT